LQYGSEGRVLLSLFSANILNSTKRLILYNTSLPFLNHVNCIRHFLTGKDTYATLSIHTHAAFRRIQKVHC